MIFLGGGETIPGEDSGDPTFEGTGWNTSAAADGGGETNCLSGDGAEIGAGLGGVSTRSSDASQWAGS